MNRLFSNVVGLDKRALALFRIGYGLMAIGDLWNRSFSLSAHYTDIGLMPRKLLFDLGWDQASRVMPYFMVGSFDLISALFVIHGAVAFCFAIGYKTRLFGWLLWLLTVSLQFRNPWVLHSGDVYFRCILLLSLFTPLGERWSIDATMDHWIRMQKGKSQNIPNNNVAVNVGTFALQLQVLFLYLFSTFYKDGVDWTVTHDATYYALSFKFFRAPIGGFLLLFPSLLRVLTMFTYYFERYGCFLLFSPFKTAWCKSFVAVSIIFLHLGLGVSLRLGLFVWCTMLAAVFLFPRPLFDFATAQSKTRERLGLVVYVDLRRVVMAHFLLFFHFLCLIEQTAIKFAHMEEDQSLFRHPFESSRQCWLVVVTHDSQKYVDFRALTELFRLSLLPPLWLAASVMKRFPRTLCQRVDDAMTMVNHLCSKSALKYRTSRGYKIQHTDRKSENGRKNLNKQLWDVWDLWWSVFYNLCCLILIIVIFRNNLIVGEMPPAFQSVSSLTSTGQIWNMFSPNPPHIYMWFMFKATSVDGETFEIFGRGLDQWERSTWKDFEEGNIWTRYQSHRWFKYMENGYSSRKLGTDLKNHFAKWVCRTYNSMHEGGSRMGTLLVYQVGRRNTLEGSFPIAPASLWEHNCLGRIQDLKQPEKEEKLTTKEVGTRMPTFKFVSNKIGSGKKGSW